MSSLLIDVSSVILDCIYDLMLVQNFVNFISLSQPVTNCETVSELFLSKATTSICSEVDFK